MIGTCLQHSYTLLNHLQNNLPDDFKKAKLCQGVLNGYELGSNEKTNGFHCWIEIDDFVITQSIMTEDEDNCVNTSDSERFKITIEHDGQSATAIFIKHNRYAYYGKDDNGIALVKSVRRWSAKQGIHLFMKHGFNAFTKSLDKLHRKDWE